MLVADGAGVALYCARRGSPSECSRPASDPVVVPTDDVPRDGPAAAEPTTNPEVIVNDHVKSLAVAVLAGFLALALAPVGSDAQVRFGGQLNFADDTDFGLGPRVAFDLEELGPRFQIIGTWDIYFPDNDLVDFWELNGNLVYRFELPDTDGVEPYGGGGLNVARTEVGDVGDTDLGLNILGGVEFPLTSVTPFVELRVTAEGSEQLYITGGVLVP